MPSVLGLFKAGLGVTLLPGDTMGFSAERGLVSQRLPPTDHGHPISLIRRWNARMSPAAQALIELLKASLVPQVLAPR